MGVILINIKQTMCADQLLHLKLFNRRYCKQQDSLEVRNLHDTGNPINYLRPDDGLMDSGNSIHRITRNRWVDLGILFLYFGKKCVAFNHFFAKKKKQKTNTTLNSIQLESKPKMIQSNRIPRKSIGKFRPHSSRVG